VPSTSCDYSQKECPDGREVVHKNQKEVVIVSRMLAYVQLFKHVIEHGLLGLIVVSRKHSEEG
jgi:hypothetical protein